jgi:hypothetical protein
MRADQARQVPINIYLERSGILPAKSLKQGRELWYTSPLRDGDSTPSFKVDVVLNLWFDHGMARGGNIIDLVIEMRRVTVREALAILESGFGGSVPATRPLVGSGGTPAVEKEKEGGFEIVDQRVPKHPALIQYLEKRCIDIAVAQQFLKEIRFRRIGQLKTFFALGFASGDGFDTRSPLFKGFVGTGKDISSINFTDRSTVAVFEGAFDFLTWLTVRDLVEPDCAVIILHSVALRRRALTAITEYGFGRVLLYLDHDQAGRDTTAFFHAELGNRNVVDRSGDYAGFKDLNEWRMLRKSGELTSGGTKA